jgi:hypothetical protein
LLPDGFVCGGNRTSTASLDGRAGVPGYQATVNVDPRSMLF